MICAELAYFPTNPTTPYFRWVDPPPADTSTCQLVVLTREDLQNSVPEILQLTPEQGAQIGAAIWLVWALVWGIRQVARSLNTSERE